MSLSLLADAVSARLAIILLNNAFSTFQTSICALMKKILFENQKVEIMKR
jgi:hypothetical protein